MPQAFGCIDGTYIHIKRPIENSQDYYNYKQFFSLNVQAVGDSPRRFIDVECKWPGSVHDAKEFAYLVITKNVWDSLLPITYPVTRTRSYYKLFNWWYSISLNSLFHEKNTRAALVTLKLSSISHCEAQGINLNVHLEN